MISFGSDVYRGPCCWRDVDPVAQRKAAWLGWLVKRWNHCRDCDVWGRRSQADGSSAGEGAGRRRLIGLRIWRAPILWAINKREQFIFRIVRRDHELAIGVTGTEFYRKTTGCLGGHEALGRERAHHHSQQGESMDRRAGFEKPREGEWASHSLSGSHVSQSSAKPALASARTAPLTCHFRE